MVILLVIKNFITPFSFQKYITLSIHPPPIPKKMIAPNNHVNIHVHALPIFTIPA